MFSKAITVLLLTLFLVCITSQTRAEDRNITVKATYISGPNGETFPNNVKIKGAIMIFQPDEEPENQFKRFDWETTVGKAITPGVTVKCSVNDWTQLTRISAVARGKTYYGDYELSVITRTQWHFWIPTKGIDLPYDVRVVKR